MLSTLAFESKDKASSQLNLCDIMAVEEQCNIYVTFESPKNVEVTVWDNLKSGLKGVFAATHTGVIDRSFGLSLVHPEVSTTVTVYGHKTWITCHFAFNTCVEACFFSSPSCCLFSGQLLQRGGSSKHGIDNSCQINGGFPSSNTSCLWMLGWEAVKY